MRRDDLSRKLALAAGSLLIAALAGELAAHVYLGDAFRYGEVRAASWAACARHDADFGWAGRPGARVHVTAGPIDYRARINSAGFRDRERANQTAPGVRRIVLLGDSMSWGWGVEEGERFSDLLDERLGSAVEVINLAVPGYGTDQELWLLEEVGLRLRPAVVLLGFVLNDVVDAQRKHRYGMWKPRYAHDGEAWSIENRPAPAPSGGGGRSLRELGRALSSWSALASLVRLPRRPELAASDEMWIEEEGGAPPLLGRATPEQVRRFCERIVDPGSVTYMLLGRVAERCAASGARLIAFSLPHNHDQHLYNPGAEPSADAEEESLLARNLAAAGRALGFQTVSIDAALAAQARAGRNLDCGDGHYNAPGNRAVADALEPVLRAALAE